MIYEMDNLKRKKEHIYTLIRKHGYQILLCLMIIIVNGIYFNINNMANTDEFSSIAVPAYYAGMDWSDLVSEKAKWHGWGHTILLTPIFAICKSAYTMYKACQVECLIFRVFGALIVFRIANNHLGVASFKSFFVALACDLGTLAPDDGFGLSAMTEIPLTFFMCLITMLTLEALEKNGKIKFVYSVIIGGLLIYLLNIHSRAIIFIAVYFVAIFILCIRKRKCSKQLLVASITCIAFYFVYRLVSDCVIDSVYTCGDNISSLNNVPTNMASSGVKNLINCNVDKLVAIGKVGLGLTGSFSIFSFGVVIIVSIACVFYIVKWLCDRKSFSDKLFLTSFIGVAGFWGMNFSLSVKWSSLLLRGNMDVCTYMRYAFPFAYMLVFSGLIIIEKKVVDEKKIFFISFLLNIVIMKCFYSIIVSEMSENGAGIGHFQNYFDDKVKAPLVYFGFFILIVLFVTIIYVVLNYYNKMELMIVIYVALSLALFYDRYEERYNRSIAFAESVDETIDTLEQIKRSGEDVKVYYSGNGSKYLYMLRTLNPNDDMKYINFDEIEKESFEDSILLVDDIELAEISNLKYIICLDENEWLCTNMELDISE